MAMFFTIKLLTIIMTFGVHAMTDINESSQVEIKSPFTLTISVKKTSKKHGLASTNFDIKTNIKNSSKYTYLIHSFDFNYFKIVDKKGVKLPHSDIRDIQGLAFEPEPTRLDYTHFKPGDVKELSSGNIVKISESTKNECIANFISVSVSPIPLGKYIGTIEFQTSQLNTSAAKDILASNPALKLWQGRVSSTFEFEIPL